MLFTRLTLAAVALAALGCATPQEKPVAPRPLPQPAEVPAPEQEPAPPLSPAPIPPGVGPSETRPDTPPTGPK
jgi:hypothetical protein